MVTPINKRKVTEWSHIDENMTRRHACKFKDGLFNIVKILMSKRWIFFFWTFEETYPYFYTLKKEALQAGRHHVSVYLFPEAKCNGAYCRVRLCNTCCMIERLHYHHCNSNVQEKYGTMHLCGNIKMLPSPSLQSKHHSVGDAASLMSINMVSVANVTSLTVVCITGSVAWCPQRQIAHWVHPPV